MGLDMKHLIQVLGGALTLSFCGSIPSYSADASSQTTEPLAEILAILSDYQFGDVETWRPDMIEAMQAIYQKPDTHRKAAAMMLDFLNSDASTEAKNEISVHYRTLAEDDPVPQANVKPSAKVAASPLMIQVARLNEEFRNSHRPVAFLKRKLNSEPNELRPHVIRLVRELPSSFQKGISLCKIDGLSSHNQAQLLKLLAARNDPSIHSLAVELARSEVPELRIAALESLQTIGKAQDVDLLIQIALSQNEPEQSLAQEALYRIPGKAVDQAITRRLQTERLETQIEVIKAIENRNTQSATSELLAVASQTSGAQLPAIRAIALVAPLSGLSDVIDSLETADSSKVKKELETAIYRIAFRHGDRIEEAISTLRSRMLATDQDSLKASLGAVLDKLEILN